MRMAVQIALHVLRTGDVGLPRRLQTFRHVREELGDLQLAEDFRSRQYEVSADRLGTNAANIESVVREWIERRPLSYLNSVRYEGVAELFEALKAAGKRIAIYSDYPAAEKRAAMRLQADYVVAATDDDVARLKPHPAGLAKILAASRVDASRCLLIGDRYDRDGEAARRLGVRTIVRSAIPLPNWDSFVNYHDPAFSREFIDCCSESGS